MPPKRELGVDALLGRDQSELFQALDLAPRERLVREFGERGAAPEPKCRFECLQRLGRLARSIRPAALLEKLLEPVNVDLLRLDLQHVAAGSG